MQRMRQASSISLAPVAAGAAKACPAHPGLAPAPTTAMPASDAMAAPSAAPRPVGSTKTDICSADVAAVPPAGTDVEHEAG